MVEREALLALAERCEKATGPDYDLDCRIHDLMHPGERAARYRKIEKTSPFKGRLGPADLDGYVRPWHSYTAVIDAAVVLVPKNCIWDVVFIPLGVDQLCSGASAHVTGVPTARAATPALALCAAALRARAAQGNPQ